MKLIPLAGRGNEYLFNPDGSPIIWVSRAKKGFQRLQRSLRTDNVMVARDERDKLFAIHFGEKKFVSKKVKQLNSDLWPEWALTKDRKSQATKDSIKYSGQHLLPMIADLYPDQVNETYWENVYIPAKRREKPDRKFFNEWKWLTTYLNYLHREGLIERLPRLQCPDGPRAEGLFLEDAEMVALYEFGNEDLSLQIDLGFRHFMRRSEVLLLPFKEIDFKRGVIELPPERTKIRKARSIPLNERTLGLLKARKGLGLSEFVFPSPDDHKRPIGRTGNDTAWKNTIARANADRRRIDPSATFHDLRHSGLTRAFAATNRYAEICVVAGLSLEEAQRTYLHLKPDHTRFVSALVGISGEQ